MVLFTGKIPVMKWFTGKGSDPISGSDPWDSRLFYEVKNAREKSDSEICRHGHERDRRDRACVVSGTQLSDDRGDFRSQHGAGDIRKRPRAGRPAHV